MPIVKSIGRLVNAGSGGVNTRMGLLPPGGPMVLPAEGAYALATGGPDGTGYHSIGGSYATLYRTQPALRTVIEASARNIAQLGLQTFERVSDTDRRRDTDSPLAQLLAYPNPYTTPYRLIEHTLIDFGVFGNAYLLKLRAGEGEAPYELWRLPAARTGVRGVIYPEAYSFRAFDGSWFEIPASEVIHFREINIDGDSQLGTSKVETLRKKLLAEVYAQDYRINYWRQGARIPGVIHRPLDAPEWGPDERTRFRQMFAEVHGGSQGAGLVPVLDEGMEYHEAGHSAEEQQLAEARELHDEEVARAFHIPLPVVGLLRRSTFANVKELHKMLYQDGLGPTIQMVEQEIEAGLVSEFAVRGTRYVEFNVREKLRGSFEEQVASLSTALGGHPWLTVNEARALQNLSRSDDPAHDDIPSPLNMSSGADAAAEAGAEGVPA
jgi:HK97 family phage portal protein